MRNLLSLFFIFFIGCSTPVMQSQSSYQNVINFTGLSKQKIYEKSLQWIAHSFKSAKAILEYQNTVEGKIIGNISMSHSCGMAGPYYVNYTITIDVKNEKARIILEARSMSKGMAHDMPLRANYYCPDDLTEEIKKDSRFLQDDYNNFIKSSGKADSNW